jgi:hypothetical protein
MHVHSRLPGRRADIHPDVVSVGRVLGMHKPPRIAKKFNNRDVFLGGHFKEVGHMALRNHKNVAAAQSVIVRAHIGKPILS